MKEEISPEIAAAAQAQLAEWRVQFPSMFFVPNIGQERAFKPFRRPENRGDYPFQTIFGGGNGVGKTAALANFAIGAAFGPDLLSDFFDDYHYFRDLQEMARRRGRPLSIRIVCQADSMKEGGSVLQGIRDWFPVGRYKLDKAGKTFYSQIKCDTGVVIDIKSFDQDELAHAGPTIDLILFDEPCPEAIYGESIARTRGGGRLIFFLTPLKMAGWMLDKVVDPADGKEIVVTNASLWDNCVDIPGTRGHLRRDNIERIIRAWERINPDEVEARVNGTFTHLSGAIYKIYSPKVHDVQPFPIPREWPIYFIIDPHDSKPPAMSWFAQGPHNAYGVDEWPREDFTQYGTNHLTIPEICKIAREKEAKWPGQVKHRIMDPNKGSFRLMNNDRTVQQEFAEAGLDCTLCTDNMEVGHDRVRQMLFYDKSREVNEYNRPYLYFFNDLFNLRNAVRKYGLKRKTTEGASLTTNIDPKYKDFADDIRYFGVSLEPFAPVAGSSNFWDQMKAARIRKG